MPQQEFDIVARYRVFIGNIDPVKRDGADGELHRGRSVGWFYGLFLLTGESVQNVLKIENAVGPAAYIGRNAFQVYLIHFHFMAQQLKQADIDF